MAEILDIVDEQGRPTGQTVPRAVAHAEGIRHRTSHVWILRRHAGRVEVLLQMRCQAKDSFPGCYDISSAGHIPAGCDFVESALRELREELGVTLPADALQECGVRHFTFEDVFHVRLFKDNQVSKPVAGQGRRGFHRAERGDRLRAVVRAGRGNRSREE